jgi:hypothetical protein
MGHPGAQLLRNPEIRIFITSPNRITPFHFDAEVNFLVQIARSKDLWVCHPNNRTVTTEAELGLIMPATSRRTTTGRG